jgi:Ca-activated chloride channel homolog
LMTDGLHNTGPSPLVAAQAAKADNIRIITVTFDTQEGIPLMKEVAAITKGKHFHAPTITELKTIFESVGLGTDGLQYVDP